MCRRDDSWIGSKKTVNISPYFQLAAIEGGCQYSCGEIAAATSEIGDFIGDRVGRYESWYYTDLRNMAECLLDELFGDTDFELVFPMLCSCLDKLA